MGVITTMDRGILIQEADYHDIVFSLRRGKLKDPHSLFEIGFKGRQYWTITEHNVLVAFVSFRHSDFTKRLYILDQIHVQQDRKDSVSLVNYAINLAFEQLRSVRHLATICVELTPECLPFQSTFAYWKKIDPERVHITPRG